MNYASTPRQRKREEQHADLHMEAQAVAHIGRLWKKSLEALRGGLESDDPVQRAHMGAIAIRLIAIGDPIPALLKAQIVPSVESAPDRGRPSAKTRNRNR